MMALAPASLAATIGLVLASTEGGRERELPGLSVQASSGPRPPAAAGGMRLLIVGDSVAFGLGREAEELGPELGLTAWNRARVGCGLVRGSQRIRLPDGTLSVRAQCPDWAPSWAADVEATRPDVVLVVLDAPAKGDLDVDGAWLHPCEPAFDAYYEREAAEAIHVLGHLGAAVAFASAPYVDAFTDFHDNRARTDCANAALERAVLASPIAEILPLHEHLCPSRECREREGGVLLRPDGTHFQGDGARAIVRWMAGVALPELPLASLRANGRPVEEATDRAPGAPTVQPR